MGKAKVIGYGDQKDGSMRRKNITLIIAVFLAAFVFLRGPLLPPWRNCRVAQLWRDPVRSLKGVRDGAEACAVIDGTCNV